MTFPKWVELSPETVNNVCEIIRQLGENLLKSIFQNLLKNIIKCGIIEDTLLMHYYNFKEII
jgi:hypothetical protein